MRVMITCFPAPAHFWPLVPYAWALQSAGHDVRVVAPSGFPSPSGIISTDFAQRVTESGIVAVPCGPQTPLAVHDCDDPGYADVLPNPDETERYVRALSVHERVERDMWDVFYHYAILAIRNYQPPRPREDIDDIVAFAKNWRPDLVLWEPWFPCGAVAAKASGAAHVRTLISPDYTAWAHERFVSRGLPSMLAEAMQPLADHHGVTVDDELLMGQATLDPIPAGMRLPTRTPTVPVRYLPYSGGSVSERWLRDEPTRPRMAISLGVSARAVDKGDSTGRIPALLEAVDGLDVEVIATLNKDQLSDQVGTLPDNVRAMDYVPLSQLLPTCSALVNHGSFGTVIAGLANAVPQIVCDTDEPTRFFGRATPDGVEWDRTSPKQGYSTLTSNYLADRGAGSRLDHQKQSISEIRSMLRRVVEDPEVRDAALRLREEEWASTPTPAQLVPWLEKLAQER
ncbi:nucleotide disphospho-sugar-binding domain-containing protein [Amycolatopsis sp. MtRt-6]|uniref:nucleotide disphospho-sugar-binding domain-containing protein n=1 Tax=Amycolatopsis sp. MtRt-6 TaxID=2792782 RepID=UPI001A902AB8|nr:nucleotide disphospho-sugar-binding domain-containing protein [Amycolatopsis sp. MtRt-6]